MSVYLELIRSRDAGVRYFVYTGQTLVLGRSPSADLPFPDDVGLSDRHCAIEARAHDCVVRDLGSAGGTFVNGRPITETVLGAGDILRVGSVGFAPSIMESLDAAPGGAPVPSGPVPFFRYLESLHLPLYCLLDAACSVEIPRLIDIARGRVQCLYEGPPAQELADWAPYLMTLTDGAGLLQTLLERGWGRGWASYFVSQRPFAELRRHFRRFLRVRLDDGRLARFRFYDPRVLREFLPTMNSEELRNFFGPVDTWMVESKHRQNLLRFDEVHGQLSTVVMATSIPTSAP